MTRRRGIGRWLAAAAALAALAACSTSVTGHGDFAGGTPTGTVAPTTTDAPTDSGSPTATDSSSPTSSSGSRSSLSCSGGKVLQPNNAPYCYVLPAGFKDVSALTSTTVGQSGEHPSSVALSSQTINATVRDLIIVLDFTLRLDTDELSDDDLIQQLNVLITQFEAQGFTFSSRTPERTSIDGARAFTYHARSKDGYSSDLIFAFRGKQEVELNCQFKIHQPDILNACGQIKSSLQILSPS